MAEVREVVKENFESAEFIKGFLDFLNNQKTVYTLSEDADDVNKSAKVATSFAKAVFLGTSFVLGTFKETNGKFGILLRDPYTLEPLTLFFVEYREPLTPEDNGSFALGIEFKPAKESIPVRYMEFSDPIVIGKIGNTLLDRDKIEFYSAYIEKLSAFLFKYYEEYLNKKWEEDDSKTYEVELEGFIIGGVTYSQLTEKKVIYFTPYEEMKRQIKSDAMLEIAKSN